MKKLLCQEINKDNNKSNFNEINNNLLNELKDNDQFSTNSIEKINLNIKNNIDIINNPKEVKRVDNGKKVGNQIKLL